MLNTLIASLWVVALGALAIAYIRHTDRRMESRKCKSWELKDDGTFVAVMKSGQTRSFGPLDSILVIPFEGEDEHEGTCKDVLLRSGGFDVVLQFDTVSECAAFAVRLIHTHPNLKNAHLLPVPIK
jgi:hypothetical protein